MIQIFTTFITVPDSKPREQNPTIQIQVVSQSDLSGDKNVSVLHLNHNQHDNINIQLQVSIYLLFDIFACLNMICYYCFIVSTRK